MKEAIIIFTRIPVPKKTKTRLEKCLTPIQCANLHKNFIKDIYLSCKSTGKDIFIFYTPDNDVKIIQDLFINEKRFYSQTGDDIGYRMGNAIETVLNLDYTSCVLIGTDIPSITSENINESFKKLKDKDVVLTPTYDGGYCLIGMKKPNIDVFIHQSYSHDKVIENTISNLEELRLSYSIMEGCLDIDEREDIITFWENREKFRSNCIHTIEYMSGLEWLTST